MQDLAPGGQLGSYRILSIIGRGGMGVVYLAEDPGLDRRVALKVLAPQFSADSSFRNRFERESRLAASLDHPNVVPVYEAGEIDGVLFISMRYVAGPDLRTVLDSEGRFDAPRAIGISSQLASALDAAHEHGLIHRDVKPGNVLLAAGYGSDGGEHVYLSDFGLTKRSASKSGLTQLGQLVGTIDYIAPEQMGGGTVDGRADIYALGCVFYEMLAGRPPFLRETDLATMAAHLHEPPPSLTAVRPDLPPAADPLIARVLAKDPDQRYSSATEFVRDARIAMTPGVRPSPADTSGRTDATVIAAAAPVSPSSPTVLADTNVPPAAAAVTAAAAAATIVNASPSPDSVSAPVTSVPAAATSVPAAATSVPAAATIVPPPSSSIPPPGSGPFASGGNAPPYVPTGAQGYTPPPPPKSQRQIPLALVLAAVGLSILLVAGVALAITTAPHATPTSVALASPHATLPAATTQIASPVATPTSAQTALPPTIHPPTPTPITTPTSLPTPTLGPPATATPTQGASPTPASDPFAAILNPNVINRATCTSVTPGTEVFDNVASELSCPLDIKGNQHVDRLYYLFNSQDQLDAAWNKYHPSLAANNELCPSPDGSFYPHDWYYRPGKTIGHDVCYVLSDGSPALEATYNFWKLYVIFIGVPGLNKSDVADVWSNTDGVYAPSQ